MKNILDLAFNSTLKQKVLIPDSFICLGQKGSGKSTLFSLISRMYADMGYNLLSSYPMADCFQIPLKKNNRGLLIVDKEWLFNANLDNSVIFIDEAADVWPSREFSRGWTVNIYQIIILSSQSQNNFMFSCFSKKVLVFNCPTSGKFS